MDRIIPVEPAERLLSIEYIAALASSLSRLRLSRRKVIDYLADAIFGWLETGGRFVDECGNDLLITPDTIDEVHGKDGTFRIVSSLMAYVAKPRTRRSRHSLLPMLRVYDIAMKASGAAVLPEVRRAERAAMGIVLRGFSRVTRVRYLREVRRLRRSYKGDRRAFYAAAVHRLRVRFAAEQAAWEQHQAR